MFNDQIFNVKPVLSVPQTCKVIFVADLFVDDYVGGAELTTEALITSSPIETWKLRSRDVTLDILKQGSDKFWIFGNFAELNPQLIPSIVANLRYSILEYDYKYCRFRSPEKHLQNAGTPCDCHNQLNGKLVSSFFYGAMHVWWMSEKQRERYVTMFPFLADKDNTVLSSVFDDLTLGTIKKLRQEASPDRHGWIVLGSNSWVKGFAGAKEWCERNKKEHEVVWNIPYEQLLEKLSKAEGFVYLPAGADTCPRMVIEAKLLGCKLQLNDFVQHKNEEWFATDDLTAIEEYLYTARKTFWNGIKAAMDYRATISGYTTTYNCIKQGYPFEQCIQSMLTFCDEVCVVDGGSTDETWDRLRAWALKEPRLVLRQIKRDWTSKRHPVFDGMQKAEARAMCTKEFCWQMDSDEVVHEDDAKKVVDLCRILPGNADIISLPVIEYWGGPDKVRMDIQPWKWRLSRNKPNITHGIPKELRRVDADGELCASEGTDGCDMIDKETYERLPHVSFYTPDIESCRQVAMLGNEQARQEYERWFNLAVTELPSVFHYSWHNLSRKIRLYRDYWTKHWVNLAGGEFVDSAEQNMMFDVPWSQVTEEMIEARAAELKQIGGWIWHRKWKGEKTPWITCQRRQPSSMKQSSESIAL